MAAPRKPIRIMPNTPCAVGEGVILWDANTQVTEAEASMFTSALSGAGVLDRLEGQGAAHIAGADEGKSVGRHMRTSWIVV